MPLQKQTMFFREPRQKSPKFSDPPPPKQKAPKIVQQAKRIAQHASGPCIWDLFLHQDDTLPFRLFAPTNPPPLRLSPNPQPTQPRQTPNPSALHNAKMRQCRPISHRQRAASTRGTRNVPRLGVLVRCNDSHAGPRSCQNLKRSFRELFGLHEP